MAKKNDRIVSPTGDGQWKQTRVGASKPAKITGTQAEAIASAHQMLEQSGGGELSVQGRNGQIRQKDTIPPGNDPYPPKG